MVRSLWNAATGMNGQQANIDTISNNLSNVNTTGFKQHRAEFEDLLYQNVKLAGTPATEDTVTPVGLQMGSGVKLGATQRIMTQGSLQNTGVDTDVAIAFAVSWKPLIKSNANAKITTRTVIINNVSIVYSFILRVTHNDRFDCVCYVLAVVCNIF